MLFMMFKNTVLCGCTMKYYSKYITLSPYLGVRVFVPDLQFTYVSQLRNVLPIVEKQTPLYLLRK